MKKIILILALGILVNSGMNAQIGGLSASKLVTLSATTVPEKKMEFEPAFAISRAIGEWGTNDYSAYNSPISFANEFGFRFTYGVSKNMETGISLPVDVSGLNWGVKYRFIDKQFFSFSAIAGLNFDFSMPNSLTQLGIGQVTTLQYTDNISTDIDAHFLRDFYANEYNFAMGIDNGIYLGDVQYIVGVNYYNIFFDSSIEQSLYLTPGVTIEPANNFLMVLSLPYKVWGINTQKYMGFSFALTITID